MMKSDTKNFLLDIIFPNRCPFCDGFIKWDKLSCGTCYDKIEWHDKEYDIYDESDKDGVTDHQYFIAAHYSGLMQAAIIKLKYNIDVNLVKLAAGEICRKLEDLGISREIDCVIPVPMGRKKKRLIGYNHAEVIADELAALLKTRKRTDCIFKHDSKKAQHTMTAAERAENVKDQYFMSDKVTLKGKTILLCDDVITTGATVRKCAELIKLLGAEKIFIAAIAGSKG